MAEFDSAARGMQVLERESVHRHPFIQAIIETRTLTRSQYAAYLIETYHLVKQTPHYLAAGAASAEDDSWLRDWLLDFATDERGHDLLCVHDLKKLSVDVGTELRRLPGIGASAMIAQNHHCARKDPVGIIGFACATEGLGASLAAGVGSKLEATYPFTRGATSFLKVHGQEDAKHIENVKAAFERYATDPDRRALMIATWRATLVFYGQLFSDSMARGAEWLEAPNATGRGLGGEATG